MYRPMLLALTGMLLAGTALGQPDAPQPATPVAKAKGMAAVPAPEKTKQIHVTVKEGKLNLTDAQEKEMAALRIALQKKNVPLLSKVRMARLEIEQVMLSDKPEKEKVARQMKEIADLELQVKLNQLDHRFAVRGLLTPEQLKEWKDGPGGGMGVRAGRMLRGRMVPGAGGVRGRAFMLREGMPIAPGMHWTPKGGGEEKEVLILRGEGDEEIECDAECEEECTAEVEVKEDGGKVVIEKKVEGGAGPAKVIIRKRTAK